MASAQCLGNQSWTMTGLDPVLNHTRREIGCFPMNSDILIHLAANQRLIPQPLIMPRNEAPEPARHKFSVATLLCSVSRPLVTLEKKPVLPQVKFKSSRSKGWSQSSRVKSSPYRTPCAVLGYSRQGDFCTFVSASFSKWLLQ